VVILERRYGPRRLRDDDDDDDDDDKFDNESLTANLHDKLRRIALYHYTDCRMQTADCTMQYSAIHTGCSLVATRL